MFLLLWQWEEDTRYKYYPRYTTNVLHVIPNICWYWVRFGLYTVSLNPQITDISGQVSQHPIQEQPWVPDWLVCSFRQSLQYRCNATQQWNKRQTSQSILNKTWHKQIRKYIIKEPKEHFTTCSNNFKVFISKIQVKDLQSLQRWCYMGRFATTIFNATHHFNIVSNGCNIVPTLQRCVAQKHRRCESSRVASP